MILAASVLSCAAFTIGILIGIKIKFKKPRLIKKRRKEQADEEYKQFLYFDGSIK